MSKANVKKFKTLEKPFCEHCMDLPDGSLTIEKDYTNWCIDCALSMLIVTDEESEKLYDTQLDSMISACEKQLSDLKALKKTK